MVILEDAVVSAKDKNFWFEDSFRSMIISVAQDLGPRLIKKRVTGLLPRLFDSFNFGKMLSGDIPCHERLNSVLPVVYDKPIRAQL